MPYFIPNLTPKRTLTLSTSDRSLENSTSDHCYVIKMFNSLYYVLPYSMFSDPQYQSQIDFIRKEHKCIKFTHKS